MKLFDRVLITRKSRGTRRPHFPKQAFVCQLNPLRFKAKNDGTFAEDHVKVTLIGSAEDNLTRPQLAYVDRVSSEVAENIQTWAMDMGRQSEARPSDYDWSAGWRERKTLSAHQEAALNSDSLADMLIDDISCRVNNRYYVESPAGRRVRLVCMARLVAHAPQFTKYVVSKTSWVDIEVSSIAWL